MDYSINHAISIIDLIKSVSRYAYPLLMGLLLPVIWVFFKKTLGVSSAPPVTDEPAEGAGFFRKWLSKIKKAISLNGSKGDLAVFYISITLFLGGGLLLKYGQYQEEFVRQKALSLKQFFLQKGYTFTGRRDLSNNGYKQELLEDIIYTYPEEFHGNDSFVAVVDTAIRRRIYAFNFPLLEGFLREEFKHKTHVYVDSLFQPDNIPNVKNYFSEEIVYGYLGQAGVRNKYNLWVIDNRTVITKEQ